MGCGGGGGGGKANVGRGEVTGLVTDLDGNPVRGATVVAGDRETTTNEAGSYVLTGVRAEDFNVRARVTAGGVVLRGTTLGRVYKDESTPSVNIAVYPEGNLTSLFGRVRDSSGRVLSGVRVVARPTEGGILSSAVALTDRQGYYELQDLSTDVEYQIAASGRTFGDDSVILTIPRDPSDDERTQNLVLGGVTTNAPETPTGLRAVAFTTLAVDTNARGASKRAEAIEGLKRLRHPNLAKGEKGRDTAFGNPIAIDLTWDEYPINPVVRPTGFIVYRNVVATQDNGYLLSDPLASLFSDADVNLQEGVRYTYALKAVSSGYGLDSNLGRSPLSDSASATPLGELTARLSDNSLTWDAVPGATGYTVYTYRSYPTLNSEANLVSTQTTSGTSLDVSGAGAYYLVIGQNADDTAETYSEVVVR